LAPSQERRAQTKISPRKNPILHIPDLLESTLSLSTKVVNKLDGGAALEARICFFVYDIHLCYDKFGKRSPGCEASHPTHPYYNKGNFERTGADMEDRKLSKRIRVFPGGTTNSTSMDA
jgi:hypothetical protein